MPPKRGAFSRPIMYPVNFPGLGRGLDFLLPSFLSSRKEKKVGARGQSPRFSYPKINIFEKRDSFSRSIMYPVNFPGLDRGLDFLLPSFLVSRQEKKVGAWGQSPRFPYPKINISEKCTAFPSFIEYEYQKRDAFSDCMIVITLKCDAFCAFAILGMASGEAYAIRPYIGSKKINTFSGNTVGAYCIRPTNVPFME